jgi:oligoendopeptidase F
MALAEGQEMALADEQEMALADEQEMALADEDDSGEEIALTDEHFAVLESQVPKFRAAGADGREKIIKQVTKTIRSTWTENVKFNGSIVMSVRERSLS